MKRIVLGIFKDSRENGLAHEATTRIYIKNGTITVCKWYGNE
tara:strand:+ start:744 stop:869 length:126 start_codon:yes stop_codon:yes gene_type:complete